MVAGILNGQCNPDYCRLCEAEEEVTMQMSHAIKQKT